MKSEISFDCDDLEPDICEVSKSLALDINPEKTKTKTE